MGTQVTFNQRLAAARTRNGTPRRAPAILLGLCLLAAAVVALPVGVTIYQALQGGLSAAARAIEATSSKELLTHTLLIAAIATPVAGVLGVACAWFVERTNLPARGLWTLLLVAPLTVPLFVTSYAWATLSPSLQGLVGAAGIVAFSYYPIVFLLVAVSLRGLDPALEESARSLGLNGRQTFFRVALPQLRPALLGGMLLIALDTLVEFEAFVGLKFQTFAVDVYSQYQLSFSAAGAAALSLLSIALCVVLLFGETWLRGGANYASVGPGTRRTPIRYRLGWSAPLVLGGLALVAAIGIGIPVGMLAYWFTQSSSAGYAAASESLRYLWPATLTSVELGVGSAVVALALSLPVAILVVRYRGRMATVLERSTYLSFALPDLVAAIALAYAASHWARFLEGGIALIVVADAILFVPFAIVALRVTLGQIEPALEDSARSLGAGPLAVLRRVTLPLARPGLAAAGVLVFAFVLGDISTTQVLLPPNMYTLGTEFQANSSTVAFTAAAPFAAVLIALSLMATYILMTRFGRTRTPRLSAA
ncbi:MAG TPA: iron ABC transporter permease [Solirubrobacteraceae bacterium]|nr:iron ABC transporter permease [Solirubrobacteraceae bacterium]